MTIQQLFITANQELRRVVDQIQEAQFALNMPAGTTIRPATLGDAVRRNIYDDAWVPDVLEGKTKEDVGDAYELLLNTGDIMGDYDEYNQRAIDAVRDFTDLERVTHLSYGDFSAHEYLQHIITFRAFRSYDIAKLIGIDVTMDATFVQALLDEYTPIIDGYRQMGVFPPALEVSADAPAQTRLLAMVGRS